MLEVISGIRIFNRNKSHPITDFFLIIYSEEYPDLKTALSRERQIKKWSRAKKLALVDGDLERLKMLSKRKV